MNAITKKYPETLTSTDLAKIVFKSKKRDDIVKNTTLISYRMNKWCKENIIYCCGENGHKEYSLNSDKVSSGDSFLEVNGKKIDMGDAIVIEMGEDNYLIKFITEK